MWKENETLLRDYEEVCGDQNIPWQSLHGKTILVTGATGMIGASLIKTLLYYAVKTPGAALRVVAPVRNMARASSLYSGPLQDGAPLELVPWDALLPFAYEGRVDYIIHGANVTASSFFASHPLQTIHTALRGTETMLETARAHDVASMVYLSSMEVYGVPEKGTKVYEDTFFSIDPVSARSSYPESKRMAETLCAAFHAEYNVPAKIARLTQTFGAGADYEDKRVYAEFARSAMEGKDIVLLTKGDTERSYVYLADAVGAILTILLKGAPSQAYNVANPETYCAIRDMAALVADAYGCRFEIREDTGASQQRGFAKTLYMDLSIEKLERLGWQPRVPLKEMFDRMIRGFRGQ